MPGNPPDDVEAAGIGSHAGSPDDIDRIESRGLGCELPARRCRDQPATTNHRQPTTDKGCGGSSIVPSRLTGRRLRAGLGGQALV